MTGKGRGWHGESGRHAAARRGIKTKLDGGFSEPGVMSNVIGKRLDDITKALRKDGLGFGADTVKEAEWKASSDEELSHYLYKAANYFEKDLMEFGKEKGWSESEFDKAMVHVKRIHKLAEDLTDVGGPPEFFGR